MEVKELFGKRLQQARKMAGLSLRSLADKSGGVVSHNALAKYERGEMMPDGKIFAALAKALGQKEEFFFRPITDELELVEFRDKSKLSVKQEKKLRHQAQDHFERYIEIELLLGLGPQFKNPLENKNYGTFEDVEKAADDARKKWKLGLNPILNLIEAIEDNGIKVCQVEAPDSFEGFSGWIGKQPVIVINVKNKNVLRIRQTLSHELGHILLKGHINSRLDEDKMARRFAAAFIFPKDSFTQALGGHRENFSLRELIELKLTWGISITSIFMRAKELGLISYALSKRFWDNYGNKWRDQHGEPDDDKYEYNERSDRFERLVYRAVAEGEVTRSKASQLLNITLDDLRSSGPILS